MKHVPSTSLYLPFCILAALLELSLIHILLVRLIIRVLDAATVSIEIDPAQVLATREYVDRKLDAHNKDGGAHETLARKSVQIKAGTGLTGGGTLEADRTLTIRYGNTAGTACQGNDVRLADARTPKPHKATPVSYTHLDVYKRQRLRLPTPCSFVWARRTLCRKTPRKRFSRSA